MHIAIVEDEKVCTSILEQHLQRFQEETNTEIQHHSYTNSMDFLATYQPVWDLLLLDIEMPMMDGLTLAHKIREMDTNVLIIFVTKMAQYAMAGYAVSALDYVLKPVNYYAFSMKLRKVQNLLQTKQQHFLVVQGNGFIRKMEVGMIRYIEVLGHTLTYHTPQGVISSTGSRSIRELEVELHPNGFARCNQCYLVNLKYVQSVEKDTVVLQGGECLSISRNRKKAFMQALLAYWGG